MRIKDEFIFGIMLYTKTGKIIRELIRKQTFSGKQRHGNAKLNDPDN